MSSVLRNNTILDEIRPQRHYTLVSFPRFVEVSRVEAASCLFSIYILYRMSRRSKLEKMISDGLSLTRIFLRSVSSRL